MGMPQKKEVEKETKPVSRQQSRTGVVSSDGKKKSSEGAHLPLRWGPDNWSPAPDTPLKNGEIRW